MSSRLFFGSARVRGHPTEIINSVLDHASRRLLDDILTGSDPRGALFRASLRHVRLPKYDSETLKGQVGERNRGPRAVVLGCLDSDVSLELKSPIFHVDEPFKLELVGNKECEGRVANGSEISLARRLLKRVGVGTHVDYFHMRGTSVDIRSDRSNYIDSFHRLIHKKISLTSILLENICFRSIASSTSTLVDFSTIEKARFIQCQDLQLAFKLFMNSSSTNIKELTIQLVDWESEHEHWEHENRFDNFIRSFTSLEVFRAKICGVWRPDIDIWKGHTNLRIYDATFGNEFDLGFDEIDELGHHNPKIELYGSRDEILGAPLQDGDWSEDFGEEAPDIAETLAVNFPYLTTWKVYFSEAPLGEPCFEGFQHGKDEIHQTLAHRLFSLFEEACEEYDIECKLDTIILTIQDVVVPEEKFERIGLPEMTYRYANGRLSLFQPVPVLKWRTLTFTSLGMSQERDDFRDLWCQLPNRLKNKLKVVGMALSKARRRRLVLLSSSTLKFAIAIGSLDHLKGYLDIYSYFHYVFDILPSRRLGPMDVLRVAKFYVARNWS